MRKMRSKFKLINLMNFHSFFGFDSKKNEANSLFNIEDVSDHE